MNSTFHIRLQAKTFDFTKNIEACGKEVKFHLTKKLKAYNLYKQRVIYKKNN